MGNTQWCIHGASAAAKKFATKDKPLNECSTRTFSALYKEEIKKTKKEIVPLPSGDLCYWVF